MRTSQGQHCHSTLSLTVIFIDCYDNLAAIAVIFCQNDSVAILPWLARTPADAAAHHRHEVRRRQPRGGVHEEEPAAACRAHRLPDRHPGLPPPVAAARAVHARADEGLHELRRGADRLG